MSWADIVPATEVDSPEKLGRYAQQQAGTPYPTKGQIALLRKSVNKFFQEHPQATYQSLCNVVLWAKEKRKRYGHVDRLICHGFRLAYEDGFLPELEPQNQVDSIDSLLLEAIKTETDPEVIAFLRSGNTHRGKMNVYKVWKEDNEQQ